MDKEKLIYDLIFSNETLFNINVHNYVDNIWEYDHFLEDVKSILIRSKVKVLDEKIIVDAESIIWKIKVKK